MRSPAQYCASLIQESKRIVALTGAGISTSAGIPDFRGPQGLYVTKKYDADKVFDINYFYKDPSLFFAFARDFIGLEEKIQPTFTHKFLAGLEREGKLAGVVTQNIDALHQKAGSKKVYEVHGGISVSYCIDCGKEVTYAEMKRKLKSEAIPKCSCSGVIKPDIVFFGENVKYMLESIALAESADLFFIIGSSCVVFPAAGIPNYTHGKIVVVNRDPVQLERKPGLSVTEDIDVFLQRVAQELGSKVVTC